MPRATAALTRAFGGARSAAQQLRVFDTRVGPGKHDYVHAVAAGEAGGPPVVLCPGYGAGAAFFWRNLGPLAAAGYRCYAVDWLGTGLSGRPPFTAATHDQAVAFFLDALEAWRAANGIDRFALLGHSLGGYLAARYALRHPERVERLILAGPAAIAARPSPPPDSLWYKALAAAWEGGVTPGSIVRCFGPAAPGHAAFYAEKRFHDGVPLTKAEQGAFGSYAYHILAADGSGEYALPKLLAPGAWAREPLLPALAALRAPVTFIYGERDWMDWRAGEAAAAHVRTQAAQEAALVRVPAAGHYVNIDQPRLFHGHVMRALRGEAPRADDGAPDAAPAAEGRGSPRRASAAADVA